MNEFLSIALILAGFFLSGMFLQYKIQKRRYNEELDKIKKTAEQRDKHRQIEHDHAMEAIESITVEAKKESKKILSKAVDFAFQFKKEISNQHETAREEIQKVLDDMFRFKRKVLLSSVSLKNYERKLDELRKERMIYLSLIAKRSFFELDDNSDWKSAESELRNKVMLLQQAQAEKEAQAEIKRMIREEQAREEQLEREQADAAAEEALLKERQAEIDRALLAADSEHKKELEMLRAQLEQEIEDVHKRYERAKSMAQMTKQGHVYVISNIGSFGDDVFKVGMTRRLEPLDRVRELGDASVPFEFDVHAMINCQDAPGLERALHNELSDYRMNKVNFRKEFFKVDLETILHSVKKHHGEIEYIANPAAIEYNRTLELEAS